MIGSPKRCVQIAERDWSVKFWEMPITARWCDAHSGAKHILHYPRTRRPKFYLIGYGVNSTRRLDSLRWKVKFADLDTYFPCFWLIIHIMLARILKRNWIVSNDGGLIIKYIYYISVIINIYLWYICYTTLRVHFSITSNFYVNCKCRI